MKIDAHQHFWKFDPVRDAWISEEMQVVRRDFMPGDLLPLLQQHQVDGCVAVQADQSEAETQFLLDLAAEHAWIRGVVGWVDLRDPQVAQRLEYFAANPIFRGVRHILQAEPAGVMTSRAFVAGLKTLARYDLTYDILSSESQLPEVVELVEQLPAMRLVIDHISKPDIKAHSFDRWAVYMKQLSAVETVSVKLSGLVTEADWSHWTVSDLQPYVDFCLEYFGPKRLMFGSDWPVCLLAGGYHPYFEALKSLLAALSTDEQQLIFGETATQFYDLS